MTGTLREQLLPKDRFSGDIVLSLEYRLLHPTPVYRSLSVETNCPSPLRLRLLSTNHKGRVLSVLEFTLQHRYLHMDNYMSCCLDRGVGQLGLQYLIER